MAKRETAEAKVYKVAFWEYLKELREEISVTEDMVENLKI